MLKGYHATKLMFACSLVDGGVQFLSSVFFGGGDITSMQCIIPETTQLMVPALLHIIAFV